MDTVITPSNLTGTLTVPMSKSSAHRLMICAALGDSPTFVRFCGDAAEDVTATVRCLEGLGATITEGDCGISVVPICKAYGSTELLDCGESGSTLRFLIPVAAALGGKRRFRLRGRLPERPLSPLKEELERHGVTVCLDGDILTVCGGSITGTDFVIEGNVSSQFISGLLFSLVILGGGTVTVTGKIESRPYVDMTVQAMDAFGIRVSEDGGVFTADCTNKKSPEEVSAEGDYSGAAFFVCAGALSDEGITLRGLRHDSLHGDRRIIDVVRSMGAVVEELPDGVTVRRGTLRGITIDATDIPDLVPVIAATAAAAEGETVITGVKRLRLKESDRIESTCAMVNAIGGCAVGDDDCIKIRGGLTVPTGAVDSAGDHRIAMAAAILASAAKGAVTIKGADCVKKSYPAFWEDYERLR